MQNLVFFRSYDVIQSSTFHELFTTIFCKKRDFPCLCLNRSRKIILLIIQSIFLHKYLYLYYFSMHIFLSVGWSVCHHHCLIENDRETKLLQYLLIHFCFILPIFFLLIFSCELQLYKWVCPFVGQLVGRFGGRSITRFFFDSGKR